MKNVEAVQDGKDHVSLRPTQEYLDERDISMDEALQEWAEQGNDHELSQEIINACEGGS